MPETDTVNLTETTLQQEWCQEEDKSSSATAKSLELVNIHLGVHYRPTEVTKHCMSTREHNLGKMYSLEKYSKWLLAYKLSQKNLQQILWKTKILQRKKFELLLILSYLLFIVFWCQ